jgi:predicted GNAT family acetyltransferase
MDITNNERARRFETTIDGHLAELSYRRHGDRLVIVHTEVPTDLEGMGVAGALVSAAIEFAAANGLTVVPRCPFARSWLERHPDVAKTVSIEPAP